VYLVHKISFGRRRAGRGNLSAFGVFAKGEFFERCSFESRRVVSAKIFMRLVFFLGGLAAGAFTTFRLPHTPQAIRDLFGPDDHKRLLATGYLCITILGLAVTYGCVKEVFAPERKKSK
jgi:hypothetical protein